MKISILAFMLLTACASQEPRHEVLQAQPPQVTVTPSNAALMIENARLRAQNDQLVLTALRFKRELETLQSGGNQVSP